MSKLETNTIDTVSGTTNLTIGSTNTSAISVGSPISNGLTLKDNILFDTASKGIYLGVTSATASNFLDDYEEGAWTPTAYQGITGFTIADATYTKIGRTVTVFFNFSGPTGKNSSQLKIAGLPYTPDGDSNYMQGTAESDGTGGKVGIVRLDGTSGRVAFWRGDSAWNRVSYVGTNLGSGMRFSLTYFAA